MTTAVATFPTCKEIRTAMLACIGDKTVNYKEWTTFVASHLNLPEEIANKKTSTGGHQLAVRVSVQAGKLVQEGIIRKDESKKFTKI